MRFTAILAACGLALSTLAAQAAESKPAAAEPPPAKVSQTNRMKTCNADAKTKALKGDERKAFMSECLKKKA